MDDPIDAALGFLSMFDWVSPMLQFGSMAAGAEPVNVWMPGSGMTGHEVAELLRKHGVKVGPGGFVYGDYICITVDNHERAQNILDWYGIGQGAAPNWGTAYQESPTSHGVVRYSCRYCGSTQASVGNCSQCGAPWNW